MSIEYETPCMSLANIIHLPFDIKYLYFKFIAEFSRKRNFNGEFITLKLDPILTLMKPLNIQGVV